MRSGLGWGLALWFVLSVGMWNSSLAEGLDCSKHDDAKASFMPRAFTLASMTVRSKAPDYSLLQGQWVMGDAIGTLSPKTCLHILNRQEIGVIQIWYLVRYKDAEGRLRSGWVWGGTKNKDEGRYIGGDTEPRAEIEWTDGRWMVAWSFLFPATEAYAETLSPTGADPPPADSAGIPLPAPDTLVYLVNIPVLGWAVSVATISAVILFVVMLGGMIAKAVWDQTEKGRGLLPPANKIIRPFLVSPIAFSAFWGPMYVQQGSGGLSLTMALYAFQIGFMWQHVLEKRGAKEASE